MSMRSGSAEAPGRDPVAAARPSRVLIVHGEATTRAALVRGLAYDTHAIVEAASGRAALDDVAAEPFDLILLDMKVGGLQLLRLLKGDSSSCHIPVIMIAASDDRDGIVDCLEAGADDYLSQPLHPVLLRIRASAALEKKQLRDSEAALHKTIVEARLSHEKLLKKALAGAKLEIAQLQETIKVLRRQLDATTAAAQADVDTARSSAAAELRQLRATIRVLRQQVDAAASAPGPGGAAHASSDRQPMRASDGQ